MSYTGRLITGTILVLIVTLTVMVIGVDRSVRSDLESNIQSALERQAELVLEALPADDARLGDRVRELGRVSGDRVTVIDPGGRVLADSETRDAELGRIESQAGRPEIVAALRDGMGWSARRDEGRRPRTMFVAVRGGPGVVRVARPLDGVGGVVRAAQRPVALAAILALALGIGLAVLFGRRLARPLAEVSGAARAIAQGTPPSFPWSGIRDIDRLVGDLRDMHRQLADRYEALRRRQTETAAIVDAMVEGVLSSDAKGRIVTANPAARRLLGYAESGPLPELPLLFRAREAREMVLASLRGEQVPERETEIADRICLLNARPLAAGGAVVVLHDLTRLRHLETVRRDFVANVSHELKTPLTAISGYAETLLGDVVEEQTSRRFLETILANARRMQRLVDDQLDLSRIESGHWAPRPTTIDVAQACRETWALAEPKRRPAPELTLEIAPDAAALWADPDALRQVLRNLYENAIRHTPAGGRIVARSVAHPDGVELTIADTGSGIAGEHLPRIFERFYRVDSGRSREEGGTGLGLAIVRHVVEAHGGRVWADSELGKGTAIHCWFPDPTTVTHS